jgi:hypothetical protein
VSGHVEQLAVMLRYVGTEKRVLKYSLLNLLL